MQLTLVATLIIYYVQNNFPLITYIVSGNKQLVRLCIVTQEQPNHGNGAYW